MRGNKDQFRKKIIQMDKTEKVVNGFRFLPPSLGAWIAKDIPAQPFNGDIPWTALKKPISETTFTLMTSAGINMKTDPPFDVAREKREPAWDDHLDWLHVSWKIKVFQQLC